MAGIATGALTPVVAFGTNTMSSELAPRKLASDEAAWRVAGLTCAPSGHVARTARAGPSERYV